MAAEVLGRYARGPTAGEEVEHYIPRLARCGDDSTEQLQGFLSGVARSFRAISRNDGHPPHVGWQLASCGLLRPNQARRHVGQAIYVVSIEDPTAAFGIPED